MRENVRHLNAVGQSNQGGGSYTAMAKIPLWAWRWGNLEWVPLPPGEAYSYWRF